MNDNDVQSNRATDDRQQVEQHDSLLDDLKLTAEELDGIKGGCGQFHQDDPEQPTGGGGFINNHNVTAVSDEALTPLTDLEPVDEVKGGGAIGGHNTGALRNVSGANTYAGTTT